MQMPLGQTEEVRRLEAELTANRERHFHASTRAAKLDCRRQDAALRQQMAEVLQAADFPAASATQVAAWDPFAPNAAAADWFDAEYMFGVAHDFDLAIGNPPYVESRNKLLSGEVKDAYLNQVLSDWGEKLPRGSDLLMYFFARIPKLLSGQGLGFLITQNAWLSTDYGKKFQDFSLGKFSIQRIIDTSARFFSDSDGPQINAIVVVFGKQVLNEIEYETVNDRMELTATKSFSARQSMKWGHVAAMPEFFSDVLSKIVARTNPTGDIGIGQGINVPLDELNRSDGEYPVIVKSVDFVAQSADGTVGESRISTARKGKVPALIMPRGIGDRYYCTFNACQAFSHSGVEVYLPGSRRNSDMHYCLWVYFNSSLVWLFREITGRRNLGGGLLKAEATDLKALPIEFDFDFADEAKAVFNALKHRNPLPVARETRTDEHLAIDRMIFEYFKIDDMQDRIREQLLELVEFRTGRSGR